MWAPLQIVLTESTVVSRQGCKNGKLALSGLQGCLSDFTKPQKADSRDVNSLVTCRLSFHHNIHSTVREVTCEGVL